MGSTSPASTASAASYLSTFTGSPSGRLRAAGLPIPAARSGRAAGSAWCRRSSPSARVTGLLRRSSVLRLRGPVLRRVAAAPREPCTFYAADRPGGIGQAREEGWSRGPRRPAAAPAVPSTGGIVFVDRGVQQRRARSPALPRRVTFGWWSVPMNMDHRDGHVTSRGLSKPAHAIREWLHPGDAETGDLVGHPVAEAAVRGAGRLGSPAPGAARLRGSRSPACVQARRGQAMLQMCGPRLDGRWPAPRPPRTPPGPDALIRICESWRSAVPRRRIAYEALPGPALTPSWRSCGTPIARTRHASALPVLAHAPASCWIDRTGGSRAALGFLWRRPLPRGPHQTARHCSVPGEACTAGSVALVRKLTIRATAATKQV